MSLRLIVCLLLAGAVASARQSPAPPPDQPPAARFGTATAGVVADVVVRDKRGRPVIGLNQGDFEVFEDGASQEVVAFEPYERPMCRPACRRASAAPRSAWPRVLRSLRWRGIGSAPSRARCASRGQAAATIVHDGKGKRSSVVETSVGVPGGAVPVAGSLFIVARAERLDPKDPNAASHPLAGQGVLLYPSFGEPISKKAQAQIAFALPLVLEPAGPAPTATLELLQKG